MPPYEKEYRVFKMSAEKPLNKHEKQQQAATTLGRGENLTSRSVTL